MSDNRKSCADCNATRTPLWRTGPSGPRSLCNACGIRYRKRKAQQVGGGSSPASSSSSSYDEQFQRSESPVKKQKSRRNLGEVEEAAFLLMSLSCDPVFA